jgi:NAD(P)-dependent dehydrogenase (short-subunit alcohol dehydrogenase family)
MHRTIDAIEQSIGEIDVAVLNAGTYAGERERRFSVELFRDTMETNFMGVVHGIDAVLPAFYARNGGHIVIVSSVAGFRGLPRSSAYGASKAALNNLAESLRFELEPRGIKVSLVTPGFVKTPLTDQNRFTMPFLMEVDKAADKLYEGMVRGRFEISFPQGLVLPLKVMRMLPSSLYFAIASRTTPKAKD